MIWGYLNKRFPSKEGLSRFRGLPLIPIDMSQVPVQLTRLELPSKTVARSLHGDCLDEIIIDALEELGVVIIRECPVFLSQHSAITNHFVYAPSPQSVLKALTACLSEKKISLCSVANEGKRSIRNFVSKVSSVEPLEKAILSRLPLFETQNKSFVSVESGLRAAPESPLPVASCRDFIDITQEDSKRLARLLGIEIPTMIAFLLEEVFPDVRQGNYSVEETDVLMAFVMERYQVYAALDSRLEKEMKSLPFVPTLAGRVTPTKVFDSRNELLQCIFADENVFPTGTQYTDPAALVVLGKLGLKCEDKVTAQDLYQSASKIADMSDISTAEKKSEAIKAYLIRHPTTLQETVHGTALGVLLQSIPWVSVLRQKPHGFPRSLHFWVETHEGTHFCKPTEVENKDNVNLIGSVRPVVEVDSSSQLAKYLGLDEMPGVSDVVEQLKVVIGCYALEEKPLYISVVKDIYSYLSCATNTSAVKKAFQGVENLRWMWNGDGFSSPNAVLAQKPSVDLSPYISCLPSEVTPFSNFFSKFGMREHCNSRILLQVLHMIKQKYDFGCSFAALEVKRDLQLSADILNEIKPNEGEELPAELKEKVLIPTHVEGDSCVKLAPIKDCVYCEDEWMDTDDFDENMNVLYVHPNIPRSTAQLLRIPPSKIRMLEPDEINTGDEFGQEEKLTRRLNRLLEDYTDGFAIPKELIQNADDAGANEVRFLYDERANKDAMSHLFDKEMGECQGPALWVYNDAEFEDEDFVNIKQLNSGTKELHTEKIGKFGLGFNAVYNLTDVPMLLSRHYFVIFDPNNFYLEKAFGKTTRGVRLDINKKRKKLRKYSGQFKPFNGIFGCDLHLDKDDYSYQGTLFRFPLRTKEQAVRSEIKQTHYDDKQVRDLLEIFVSGARTLLLFTQNVRRVSIFHLSNSSEATQPTLIFEVNKSLSRSGIIRELPIPVTLSKNVNKLSQDDQYFLKQCNFLRASSEVAQYAGRENLSGADLLRSALTIDMTSTITKHGSSFFGDKDQSRSASETWLLASSIGRGIAMQFSVADKTLLPSAGVAVQLMPTECGKFAPLPVTDQESRHDGTVFCYLALPLHSGLPLHINGALAVASNRRHLKERTEGDKACIGVEWNDVLLRDSVCAAYLDLLEDLKSAAGMYSFHLLWPRASYVEPNCEALARSFYQQVADGSCALFSDGNRWVNLSQVVFLEPSFREEEQIGDILFTVFKMLIEENVAVIDLPTDVLQSFVKYGLADKMQSKLYGKDRFFRELFFPNIAAVPPQLREKLILYALDEGDGKFDELLNTYPCIPASPRGQKLKCPHQLVNPHKEAASLFRAEDERYPFGTKMTLLNPLRLAKLEQLGMMADDPTWNVFAERAESVKLLNQENKDAALKRTTLLLHLLAKKLNNEEDSSLPDGVRDRILQAKFLPVASKPKEFPLFWKEDDLRRKNEKILMSPIEVFPKTAKYLVCCSEAILDINIPFIVGSFLLLNEERVTLRHVVTQLQFASSTNAESLDCREFEEVQAVCLAAYRFLQSALNDQKLEERQVTEIFQEKKIILLGREFAHANHVAFTLATDCSPYLHKLSDYLARPFRNLMKILGVKEVFEGKDFISSLERIRCKFGDTALDEKTLQIALNLVGQLANCLKGSEENGNVKERQEVIYLPDSQGVMRLADELCLNDYDLLPDDDGVNFVNELISHRTSITLGVKTRREGALERFTVGIQFGQEEKLTNRLQRILSAYPSEKEILKELIQNADDAEATEICFIKDPRNHADDQVFEDSWKPLQGPALCVYNNTPFSEADIKGIQNLGESSKGDDPNKTGQYGVGFNAVYNLTDVPSFTSSGEEIGDVLCVFDPHCKYVPGATAQAPGRMFKKTTDLRHMFPDVFSCYIEGHFPAQNSTMFRFPLRTEEMAKESKISQSSVTLEQLDRMIESLKGELFEVLLFVNNVRKITLCEIDAKGTVVNSYFVEAQISDDDLAKKQQFAAYITKTGKSKQQESDVLPIKAEVKKCSYVLNVRDCTGKEEKWLIVQQIGFENQVERSIVDACRRHDLGLLPRGGVACQLENKHTGQLPKDQSKKAYCFLPLPIETGLPVHINGHFALEHESRQHLWRRANEDYRNDWNNALVTDVIASCYLKLLDEVRDFHHLPVLQNLEQATLSCSTDDLMRNIRDYEKLFPPVNMTDPYWETLVKSVYQGMDRKKLRLLPVVRGEVSANCSSMTKLEWLPVTGEGRDKAFFNNIGVADCFNAYLETRNIPTFQWILLQTGFNLVAFTFSVYLALEQSDVRACCVSPSAVMQFYKSFSSEESFCKIGPVSVDVKETPFKSAEVVELVLRYCKDDKDFQANLPGLPLLVTQDNYLHTFNANDPKFTSLHHGILPKCQQMFVHKHLLTRIFSDAKSLKAPVFKYFDIKSFAANLHQTLPLAYYNSEGYVRWCPEQSGIPNWAWVYSVWRFVSEEINKVLEEIKAKEQENIKCILATDECKEENWRKLQKAKTTEEDKTRIIEATLEPLTNWNLLPCTEKTPSIESQRKSSFRLGIKHFLVPLGLSETVLDFHGIADQSLVGTLKKLSLAELNSDVLSSPGPFSGVSADRRIHARRLVASLRTPSSLLTSLKQKMMRNPHSLEGILTTTECDNVLHYFSSNVERLKKSDESILRTLPFYEAAHGELIDLKNREVYVVPDDLPRKEFNEVGNRAGVVFLNSRPSLSSLFNFLSVKTLTAADVYCKFVLIHFSVLSMETRLDHLEYIRDSVLPRLSKKIDEKEVLIDRLKNTEIVPANDGTLKTACCYYHPENGIFKLMLSKGDFPPDPFRTPIWLDFFKTIGMTHEISQDLFKTFANEVAREGLTLPTQSTNKKSRALVAHLFQREKVVESGLLQAVSGIKFVATSVIPELRSIDRQFDEPYIAFRGSTLAEHTNIVWTIARLLPDWANPRNHLYDSDGYCKAILYHLQVITVPTVEMVTSHCQNLCLQLVKENGNDLSSEQLSPRMLVMTEIYTFLQKNAISSTTAKMLLRDTSCIMVERGSRLVKPEQVVIELSKDNEMAPFLYGIPAELGQFKALFQYLDCPNSVLLSHYAMVLETLQRKCKADRLNPNEVDWALRAVRGLFEFLQDNSKVIQVPSSLYLPAVRPFGSSFQHSTTHVVLTRAAELLFDDAPRHRDRIRNFDQLFVVDLKKAQVRCNLSRSFKDLILLLPEALRPHMLSCVVEEKFADAVGNTECYDVGVPGSLKKQLHSVQFCRGIFRLIRHASHENQEPDDESVVSSVESRLKNIQIHGMRKIVTHLVYKGNVIPGSKREVPYFLQKNSQSEHEIWNLYVDAVNDVWETPSTVTLALSKVIKEACRGLLQDTAMYIPEMLRCHPGNISSLLDSMEIRPDDSYDAEGGDVLPLPGSFIPISHHELLNQAFESFMPGEYVGYEFEDQSMELEEGNSTFIYAVIIEEVSTGKESLLAKVYKINIGDEKEPKDVPATDLYKFFRRQEIASTAVVLLDRERDEEEAWKLPVDVRRKAIKRLSNAGYPQRRQAMRWFRQAEADLAAVLSDIAKPSYEWACFKCHQVSLRTFLIFLVS